MTTGPEIQKIVDAVRARRRFVISSHARPDGDSLGSQLAMAYALRALGKEVVVVNADPAPGPLMARLFAMSSSPLMSVIVLCAGTLKSIVSPPAASRPMKLS